MYSQCQTGLAVLNHKRLLEWMSLSFSCHNINVLNAFVRSPQSTFPPTVNSSKHSCLIARFTLSRRLMSFVSWQLLKTEHATFLQDSCMNSGVRSYFPLWFSSAVWCRHLLLIIDTACLWTTIRDYSILQGIAYIGISFKPL